MGRCATREQRDPTDDRGAAVVEMAFIGVVLVLLLFGIISFGYLMGFRQNMVQAAAEGARRGAVDTTDPATAATNGADDAVAAFGQACGAGGMSCNITVDKCPNEQTQQCVTVELVYDYANHPILPDVPIIGALMPSTIRTHATAEVNPAVSP